jgi:hypothetical protein
MKRRTAIRNFIVISAGAGLLPSCVTNDKPSLTLKHLSLTGSQEQLLAELAEMIIPKTPGFIGAKELKAHEFVLIMIDDCTPAKDIEQFSNGMKAFDTACKEKWDQPFIKCNPDQRKQWLQSAEGKKDMPEDAIKFYETTKRYTIQSFTSSKEYMTGIRKYKMVPGPNYKGCVAVNQ